MSANLQSSFINDTWKLQAETVFYDGREQTVEFAVRPTKLWNTQADIIGLPKSYQDCDISKFNFNVYKTNTEKLKKLCLQYVTNFSKMQTSNCGLYFWSTTPGTGKTFLACCLCGSIMLKHNLRIRFITDADYIDVVGESFKRSAGAEDKSEIYRTCDLLILDDIGSYKVNDWQKRELFRLINYRLDNRLLTIYTSNFAPEQQTFDQKIISRIVRGSAVIQLPEESIRMQEAHAMQQKLVATILNS